jgi:hypothetical protein
MKIWGNQVELPVAEGEPRPAKVERCWPLDLRQSQDLAVESSRTLQVRDRQRDVVQGGDTEGHGGTGRWQGRGGSTALNVPRATGDGRKSASSRAVGRGIAIVLVEGSTLFREDCDPTRRAG